MLLTRTTGVWLRTPAKRRVDCEHISACRAFCGIASLVDKIWAQFPEKHSSYLNHDLTFPKPSPIILLVKIISGQSLDVKSKVFFMRCTAYFSGRKIWGNYSKLCGKYAAIFLNNTFLCGNAFEITVHSCRNYIVNNKAANTHR